MAAFTVSTRFDVTLNLNANDSLTLTREGSVLVLGVGQSALLGAGANVLMLNGYLRSNSAGGSGVVLNAGGNNITLGSAGVVASADDSFRINGTGNTFTSSGLIGSRTGNGLEFNGGGNTLTLFATSVIVAEGSAISIDGGGNSIANIGTMSGSSGITIAGAGANTIFNGGSIVSQGNGLHLTGTGALTIVNSGHIASMASGSTGILTGATGSTFTLTNSGTIDGDQDGVNTHAASASITNNGYIIGHSLIGIRGTTGVDTVINNGFLRGADFAIWLEGGNDFFDGRNGLQFGIVNGGTGNDTLFGGAGADDLRGFEDNDQLLGGANLDRLDGGFGFDFARYDLGGAVTVSLTTPAVNTGDAAGDTFFDIEGLIGSQFADTIVGDGSVNTLIGLGGNDAIAGGAGGDTILGGDGVDILFGEGDNDFITGGAGGDVIRGGLGIDTFIYNLGDGGDFIQSFNEGGAQDKFDLRPLFDAINFTGTDPRGAGILQVLQNGADTDVFVQGTFLFRIGNTTAAAVNDTFFLFQ